MQKITPFLWFNGQAEAAANHYVSIFRDSKVLGTSPGPDGSVMSVTFELEGQRFIALNGGPQYTFTPAVSFMVHCRTQEEVDEMWAKLTEGGEEQPCGWLKDKFGVSWQVIPDALGELLQKDRSGRVVNAMLQMKKIEITKLEAAMKG